MSNCSLIYKYIHVNKVLLLFVFILPATSTVFSQEAGLPSYKVCKIWEADSYYLIFLRKDNHKYTIFSKKEIVLRGEEIKIDNIYKFDLIPVKDTLSPINYLDYRRFPQFSNDEIGMLCHARNLIGITLIPNSEIKKKKRKWFKR